MSFDSDVRLCTIMYDYVYVYYKDLPEHIHEVVMPNMDDDGYTIWINKHSSDEQARESILHALKHIRGNDWIKDDVQEIEEAQHRVS